MILLKVEEFGYLLGITHAFEHGHILAAGKDEGAINTCIYFHNTAHKIIFFGKFLGKGLVGGNEVAPYKGWIFNGGYRLRRYLFGMDYGEPFFQIIFGLFLCLPAEIHYMERIVIGILRVQAINGETSTQSITPVMHIGNSPYDAFTREPLA